MRATRRRVRSLVEEDAVLQARAAGLSTRVIADRFGLSGARVAATIRRAVERHQRNRPREVEKLRERETATLEMLRVEAIDAWTASKAADGIGDPALLDVAARLSDQLAKLNHLLVLQTRLEVRAGSPAEFCDWSDAELLAQAQSDIDALRGALPSDPDTPAATPQDHPGATITPPAGPTSRLVPVPLPDVILRPEVLPAETGAERLERLLDDPEFAKLARDAGLDS